MAEFFVYGGCCVFCVNGGGCIFCLMVVVGFLFMIVAGFLC